jgi:hypothetical protein
MSKISELGSITGANTRSEDLLVIVNLVQGDDGTKNISRKELVQAIQYEIFDRITITGGTISGVEMSDSTLDNVTIDNSNIEDTDWIRGTIDETVITNSDANNVVITSSSFTDGSLVSSTGEQLTIANSSFDDGTITNSTANNVIITNSEFNNGTANAVVITNSEFNEGTGNNVVLTNSTIDDSVITDSTANNITITSSTYTDGALADSTANNITMSSSTFDGGLITNSDGRTMAITTSSFDNGTGSNNTFTDTTLLNGTANNFVITSSQLNDSTVNNTIITSSEFNDGTGNNVVLTNSTIDDSIFTDGVISNTEFQGTMQNVVATDMTIRSSAADGLSSNNSTFENGAVSGSTFDGGTITNTNLVDFDMNLTQEFDAPMDDESYFAIRNERTGDTEQINFNQLFEEVSKKTAQALKVNVDAGSGDDANPGTMMQPVRTLERAFELCLEKAGGELNRNAINNAVHISVGPGTYYTKGNLMLPDDCSCTSTAGQYATVIEALPGYENNNGILVGSGCYVQGFGYQNWKVDNFDFPEGGFAIAYRPGAKLLRSPYLRDSTQLSNFLRQDVEPPLNPYNTKGTLADLGQTFVLEAGLTGSWSVDDEIKFSSGAIGFLTWDDTLDTAKGYTADIAVNRTIRVRNLKNGVGFKIGDTITSESGGTATIESIGIDDFPNREVGRGGGCVLADRRVLDPDSLYTYVLCFGFTPRTQNGLGYVARDGAGINGIGSLSIFVRCAFYALNGGQMTLNNSGTQFGDISMRAKGTSQFFQPKNTTATIVGNTVFGTSIMDGSDNIISDMTDYLTANSANGGLGYTGYDSVKCERDTGIIIDGVGYDVATDSNYWSRLAGITYRSPISSKVVGDQLEATIGANVFLQSRINEIFANANNEIIPRVDTSFQEMYNVVKYGEENMNPIIWQDTTKPQVAARELLQDNRQFITDTLIDWIENNEEFYAYDSKACRRDVSDYILPAVKNDMLFDTNFNAVTAGEAYYMAAAKTVIENQNNETVAAYKRLKDQTNELLDGDSYEAAARTDAAFDEILEILENKNTAYTPTKATYDAATGKSVITLNTSKKFNVSNATYDPASGVFTATIGSHELVVGDYIRFKPESIIFSCNTGSGVQNHPTPAAHHPYYNKPVKITNVSGNVITMNVGGGGPTGQQVHTFVSAAPQAISSSHGLSTGRKVLLRTGGLVFTCSRDNHTTRHAYPRASDPAAGAPIEVLGANETTITINVGASAIVDEHRFVEALSQSVSILGADIRWSDNASIAADNKNARKQLQANKTFLADYVEGYIDETYFRYDSKKCRRDTQKYILPAVERDILTGSNYNAIQTGIAYRSGTTLADNVINDQLVETIGAMNEIKSRINLNNVESGFTVTDATYDPATGVFTATIGNHGMAVGDYIMLADNGITMSCDMGAGEVNHTSPQSHHPYWQTPCPITGVTDTTITMNVGDGGAGQYPHTFVSAVANAIVPAKGVGLSFTPTTATYNPETGMFSATIGKHGLHPGDYVKFLAGGVTFSCDTGSGPQNDAVPAPSHPFYNHPCSVESVTATTITMFVGYGGSNVHTFVSALDNSITHMVSIDDNASGFRSNEAIDKITSILQSSGKTYTTTNATYDPGTGLTVLTVGAHDLQIGDEINIAANSLTFTCDTDGNVTNYTYPTTTITNFTPTNASYDPATGVFTATIGAHKLKAGDEIEIAPESIVFTCAIDGNATIHPTPEAHHPFWKKKIKLTSVDSTTITANVGSVANGGGVHTFVSALPNAIQGERQHPAYKKPVVIASTTGTTLTVNVGTSSDLSPHTFISATADNIKTAKYISTYTPTTATYDGGTGVFVASIGRHNLEAGDYVQIKPNSVVFTCALDGNVTEHSAPAAHHPYYMTPVQIDSVTADSITMNIGAGPGGVHTFVRAEVGAIDSDAIVFTDPAAQIKHYTPTTATFIPASGISVVTSANHGLTTDDWVEFAPYSFTFTCSLDGDATEHSYPRKGDVNYRRPMQITAVTTDTFTVNLGATSGGTHTFVSCEKHAVTHVSTNGQGQLAREYLQNNKDFLAADVQEFLDTQYFVFNGAKCSRDSGYILDAVRRDLATNSNYHSVFMGLGYLIGTEGANRVIYEQLTETVGAINYLKAQVAADPSVTGTALTRANASFDEIIDIMSNGRANANALTYGDEAALSVNHTTGATALINNRLFLQKEVTAYIADQFPSITYDVAKCERDTGYMIDALVWDVKYGSNAASVNFSRLYYENAISVLPEDQKLPTAKTWEHLANVCYNIVRDVAVTPTTGNTETQDVSLTDAGVEVAEAARAGVNVTTQIIRDNNLDNLPHLNEGSVEVAMEPAVNTIDGLTENLKESVIEYLRDEHNGLPIAREKCTRDVGIILDAVSRDIEYGGNENTLEAIDYYFKQFNSESADYEQQRSTNVLPVEVKGQMKALADYEDTANVSGLREKINILPREQRKPIQLAFRRLADVVAPVISGSQTTTPYGVRYTPTNAAYNPATGVFTATIGTHTLKVGDKIWLAPEGFTFSCDMGAGVQSHTSPQKHHPFYHKPVTITAVGANTITMNVGDGGSGQQPHTFVSALADSIQTVPYVNTDGTAVSIATATAAHDLIDTIANFIDYTNIEDNELPTLVKASFDSNRTLARKQLQRNRDFIIEEVQGYIKDRYYTFDGDKCKRDIALLLDGVKVDVLTGSNYNAVHNGLAYRIETPGTNKVINEQLVETVKGIEYAKAKAVAAVTDQALQTKTEEAFDEIIDIMTKGRSAADAIDYTSTALNVNKINGRSQLQNNKVFLQAEITAWLAANRPSLSYDVAKCERDLGYLIDAVSFDIQHGGNFGTLNFTRLYFENGVNVGLPLSQREPSYAAFRHIGDCAKLIVQDTDIGGLKSVGNSETQNMAGATAGVLLAADAEELFDISAQIIEDNGMLMAPAYDLPDAAAPYSTAQIAAFNAIDNIKTTVAEGLIEYVSTFYDVLPFSETKCRRDTGYIIDAVSHDIQYGGNSATVQTAGMYFENAVNTGLKLEQRMGTRDAFIHMSKVVEHVVGAVDITTTAFPKEAVFYTGDILTQYDYWLGVESYQTTEAQNKAVIGANPNTCKAARDLVQIVANAVDDNIEIGSTIPEMIFPSEAWVADNYKVAKDLVDNQRDTIAEAVITYLSSVHSGLSFPAAKCRRDIGYIVDAISHDVQYGGNFATRQAAGIYFENGVSVLPVDTRNQYSDILNILGTLVDGVVQETDVSNTLYTITPQNTLGTAATATEGTRAHDLIAYIEGVIRADDTDELPAIEPGNTGWIDAELTTAAVTIDDSTEELASDVTTFINNNFDVLDYNKAKCKRDTGFLLDAFSYDLNFGGNSASRWNADFYFWNQVYRLPEDQRIPTAKSYRHLGKICKDIVIGEYAGQVQNGEVATTVESIKVEGLANIFYKTQLYNDTKELPLLEEPTYLNPVFTDAKNILGQVREALQYETVSFVGKTYKFIDLNLTRRDAKNLLTAVSNDFKYQKYDPDVAAPTYTDFGSSNATMTYTAAFFDFKGAHVFPVFNPTLQGLKYQGSVAQLSDLSAITGMKLNHSYIVATDYATNYYAGNIYYWNGTTWALEGANNTDLLDAFTGAWDRMRNYIVGIAPNSQHALMVEGLFNDCVKDNILRPNTLVFGSLVESIAHQFNGASAGVNRNALPLNFRNLGSAISAIASVLNEDGGRIRWSGADELNNQYFARGLRINGRTGRIEGRPFTSSVRKLARRASNSRASI